MVLVVIKKRFSYLPECACEITKSFIPEWKTQRYHVLIAFIVHSEFIAVCVAWKQHFLVKVTIQHIIMKKPCAPSQQFYHDSSCIFPLIFNPLLRQASIRVNWRHRRSTETSGAFEGCLSGSRNNHRKHHHPSPCSHSDLSWLVMVASYRSSLAGIAP